MGRDGVYMWVAQSFCHNPQKCTPSSYMYEISSRWKETRNGWKGLRPPQYAREKCFFSVGRPRSYFLLRNFLLRNLFSPSAVSLPIQFSLLLVLDPSAVRSSLPCTIKWGRRGSVPLSSPDSVVFLIRDQCSRSGFWLGFPHVFPASGSGFPCLFHARHSLVGCLL